MNEERESKEIALFEDGFEVVVQGTPDMVLELMTNCAKEVRTPQGLGYGIRRTSGAPDWVRQDKTYRASCVVYIESKITEWGGVLTVGNVGVGKITLLLLPNDRTLFKVEPRSEWSRSSLDDLLVRWVTEGSEFMHFLKHLFTEFERLRFADFNKERLPISFKPPPMASKFSNRTLSYIIEVLADGYTDSSLRDFFFKYDLLDVYEQSGKMTAKKRKVTDVFQYLRKSRDENAVSTLESIVREALRERYPRADSDQGRREYFFRKFPDLDVALRADGYQVREGELVPVTSPLVEVVEEEGLIETLLDKYGFAIAKNHLKQSYENYIEGNWEAANGALRSFLQDVFDQIALIITPQEAKQKKPGGERRILLQKKGFIEDDMEAKLVTSFFNFASYKGSHSGISNESDCRLRRYMAVALASYYLEKLEMLHVQNI